MLTVEEKQRFEDEGLVVPDYRLPDDLMDELRDLTDRTIAETPHIPPDFLFSPHLPWMGQKDTSLSDGFMSICHRPEILDAIESIIGHDTTVIDCRSQFVTKRSLAQINAPLKLGDLYRCPTGRRLISSHQFSSPFLRDPRGHAVRWQGLLVLRRDHQSQRKICQTPYNCVRTVQGRCGNDSKLPFGQRFQLGREPINRPTITILLITVQFLNVKPDPKALWFATLV